MMKPTLTLLVCALMINYATCGLMCLVGVDDKAVATDCAPLTICYYYSKQITGTSKTYGCDDDSTTKCKAVRTAKGGGGLCVLQGKSNVPISTTPTPTKVPNLASDIAATKLMVIPTLVLILKRFF